MLLLFVVPYFDIIRVPHVTTKMGINQAFTSIVQGSSRQRTIFGMGTALSAPFIVLAVNVALATMLVLGDGLCPSMCLALVWLNYFDLTMLSLFVHSRSKQKLPKRPLFAQFLFKVRCLKFKLVRLTLLSF